MFFSLFRVALALSTIHLAACSTVVAPAPASFGGTAPATTPDRPPVATPVVLPSPAIATPAPQSTVAGAEALLPDPAADFTTGDTARLSGGDSGDQADLKVEEAVRLSVEGDEATYAFLVVITGLDDIGFHFNVLNFQVIDDQQFQYDALSGGGQEPALDFGDLGPNESVRGWLTFEASSTTASVELEYSPVSAIESATFGFLVP